MSLRYLLDTDTVSGLSRPRHERALVAKINSVAAACAISAVSVEEMRFGAMIAPADRRDPLLELLSAILQRIPVLPYDRVAAEWVADQRVRLRASRRTVAHPDLCIAGIAGAHGLTLVTHNTRHFEGLLGLDIEDWRA